MPKTLTREQVVAAGGRAHAVVNGFATVKQQQATDALNLAHTCDQLYDQMEKARSALAGMRERAAGTGFAGAFDDIFSKLFGGAHEARSSQPK